MPVFLLNSQTGVGVSGGEEFSLIIFTDFVLNL